ncbi:putative ino80 chromatin remodeling complex [Lyophyllum shimeji]|uniref:Ino80 chromatin remodeling complex n=1 Tax=Lyophyllum shimeji TaxID=47721 RepID=A0A9P3PI29_LYOSH|nr:putative ino80 chromatin remodeling complex [Lyophyllum shimeji]
MSSRRPSPSGSQRRTIAIKRVDGEPLTRSDIQYDVLHSIFHDAHAVFTDPYPSGGVPAPKITFGDLYLKTILRSPKATKALKDKMNDSKMFAEDFAMLALLVNVGRVNTTMSFFPEMKTAVRTYHPIPALQRTNGNLQDAPRIKHILKSSVLENGQGIAPSTPADILARAKAGQVPSTTVMNLIFVFANHSAPIGHLHFSDNLDFIDLFLRQNVSSLSRARAFLWLCYHYLESPVMDNDEDYDGDGQLNPFADSRRGNAPTFTFLSDAEMAQENADPEEEKALAEKLVAQRLEIVRSHGAKETVKQTKSSAAGSVIDDDEEASVQNTEEVKSKGKRGAGKTKSSAGAKGKKAIAKELGRRRSKDEKAAEREISTPPVALESDGEYDILSSRSTAPVTQSRYPHHQYRYQTQSRSGPNHNLHRYLSSATPEPPSARRFHHRYSPYPESPRAADQSKHHRTSHRPRHVPPAAPRSMLQQAWHIVTTTDPLLDSDEEGADEHLRYDYIQRLKVINKLRHKEPTPEAEHHYQEQSIV